MNVEKIYKEFDGVFKGCLYEKCTASCCNNACKQGVDVFPDEVIFLIKKYGKNLPIKIFEEKNSFTGFIIKKCSKNKKCLLGEIRPIFCRCYPVKPERFAKNKYKIMTHDNCPLAYKIEDQFFVDAAKLWKQVLKRRNRNWWKKLKAKTLLKNL